MNNKNRSTDGVTVNKVVVTLVGAFATLFIGLISYVYLSEIDRELEYRKAIAGNVKEISSNVKELTSDVSEINTKMIVNHARVENVDARLNKSEEDFDKFKESAYRYWRK